jgi:WD40 repeat protein
VAFSPDGENVLTGSFDGTARLWKIYPLEDFLKNGVCEKFSEEQLER